jgi:hypothetical protein
LPSKETNEKVISIGKRQGKNQRGEMENAKKDATENHDVTATDEPNPKSKIALIRYPP